MDQSELEQWAADLERVQTKLDTEQPELPYVTRIVMAQDIVGAEKVEAAFRAGKFDLRRAMNLCGSYTRLDFARRMVDDGLAEIEELADAMVQEWPGCDPDDTDERFIDLWRLAYERNGRKYLRDGPSLPRGKTLKVYRGQPENAPLGCAWSLDENIAAKFAGGAWARTAVAGGRLFELNIPRNHILAYLTRRSESEVIIDPQWLGRKA